MRRMPEHYGPRESSLRMLANVFAADALTSSVELDPNFAANRLMSEEHFTADGTLIETRANHKSFQRKDGNDKPGNGADANSTAGWHGQLLQAGRS